MVEHAGGDHGVVALEDAHDVLGRLAGVDPDFLTTRVDGMAAELDDGDLGRMARSRRRLLEDQGDAAALERTTELDRVAASQVEHDANLVGVEVGHVEQVARRGVASHRSTPARIASASSISSSETVIGGARRSAVAVTGLVTSPASSS